MEEEILIYLGTVHTAFWDTFMMIFTGRWTWVPLYAAMAVYLVKRYGWRRAGAVVAATAVVIALADQTCATLIRPAVARLRPSNPDNPLSEMLTYVNGYRGGRYGFPSCHAANTFALATLLTLVTRSRTIAITTFAWAALNCLTRLYLGVHYPTDILAGAALGSAVAALVYLLLRRLAGIGGGGERWAWIVAATFAASVAVIAAVSFCR